MRRAEVGKSFTIDERRFTVADVKRVVCLGAQGELLSCPPMGTKMISMDIRGPGVDFGTIEVTDSDIHIFTGRYVDFAECRFSGLRTLEGWAAPVARSQ
jgi:hypothetical protein